MAAGDRGQAPQRTKKAQKKGRAVGRTTLVIPEGVGLAPYSLPRTSRPRAPLVVRMWKLVSAKS